MKKQLYKTTTINYIFLLFLLFNTSVFSQLYSLDATSVNNTIKRGHIQVQPHPKTEHQYNVNSSYFEKDGKPWFPIMGEFHYNRYPNEYWEEEIIKIKSAGISIVATYIFWNTHENPKDTWDWKKDNDLRKFVVLCKKHDMLVWLRIGPWSHGEQKYGGHPKWINRMKGKRSNNPEYLKEVDKLYQQIGNQTEDLYYKDGGPIIGVQIENEYASGQAEHIDTLKQMALKNGIVPVYFTITGNTVFNNKEYGFIPLQGAYPYRGWEKGGGGATKDFLYGNDQWILTDAVGKLYYDFSQYPKGLCEQGCGSQMTFRNRFTVDPNVVEAHLQNQIGRGMNLIGYYMFQGGTQMPGLKEPGHPESYDFQAPISEFGFLRQSYKNLKILHHFIRDFGQDLAESVVVEPTNPVHDERNTKDLRYVARVNGNSGFLFLGNTQVRIHMPDKKVRFQINLPDEVLEFPRKGFLLKGETTAILPFNLKLNTALLKYATAQPVSRFQEDKESVFFLMKFNDVPVELAFDTNTIKEIHANGWKKETENGVIYLTKNTDFDKAVEVTDQQGNISKIQIISREQAENSWRLKIQGKESLLITESDLMDDKDQIELRQINKTQFHLNVFPKPKKDLTINGLQLQTSDKGIFREYSTKLKPVDTHVQVKKENSDKVIVQIPNELPNHCRDLVISLDYLGGSAAAKIKGQIVTDHLFHGPEWNFGLKRYISKFHSEELVFEILPWSNKITGIDKATVDKIKKEGPIIKQIKIEPQYYIVLKIN
jgi:hypothetical protein